MGKRGELWFVGQFILFCVIVLAPFIEPSPFALGVRLLGAILLAGGVVVCVMAYRQLGSSHSPWATPTEKGQLVTSGIYRFVRHPVYAGWILGSLGWELFTGSWLGVGAAATLFIFYDFRAR